MNLKEWFKKWDLLIYALITHAVCLILAFLSYELGILDLEPSNLTGIL